MMYLHNLHSDPKSLDHHDDVDKSPILAWVKYVGNNNELKKREKFWAKNAETSYLYAMNIVGGPFKLGEPAIAKNGHFSYLYSRWVTYKRFKPGEPAIATNAQYSYLYAKNVLNSRFKSGEAAIAKDGHFIKLYRLHSGVNLEALK